MLLLSNFHFTSGTYLFNSTIPLNDGERCYYVTETAKFAASASDDLTTGTRVKFNRMLETGKTYDADDTIFDVSAAGETIGDFTSLPILPGYINNYGITEWAEYSNAGFAVGNYGKFKLLKGIDVSAVKSVSLKILHPAAALFYVYPINATSLVYENAKQSFRTTGGLQAITLSTELLAVEGKFGGFILQMIDGTGAQFFVDDITPLTETYTPDTVEKIGEFEWEIGTKYDADNTIFAESAAGETIGEFTSLRMLPFGFGTSIPGITQWADYSTTDFAIGKYGKVILQNAMNVETIKSVSLTVMHNKEACFYVYPLNASSLVFENAKQSFRVNGQTTVMLSTELLAVEGKFGGFVLQMVDGEGTNFFLDDITPLADVVNVTLGAGSVADISAKTVSFNNSVWSGTLANGGYYYGNIYASDGTKFEAADSRNLPVYIIPGTSGAESNVVICLANVKNVSEVTEFVIKKSEIFIDGECWAQRIDYSEGAEKAWRAKTGKSVPKSGNPDYREFSDFQRKAFFNYVKHYVTEVKKLDPEFEITSNWLNSAWVPDDLNITDYISGDLSPTNSVDSARYEGRLMQSFGRNWDIMSWGISFPVHYVKSAVQLCQEAAVIISLGGGFQVYNCQSPQNTVMDEWAIPIWAEVSRFCRERKRFSHGGKPIPDVGILYSTKAYYASFTGLFNHDCDYNKEQFGLIAALCDAGKSVSLALVEKLVKGEVDLSEYSAIAVGNLTEIEDGVIENLVHYVRSGGRLLLFGKDTAELIAPHFGIKAKPCGNQPVVMLGGENCSVEVRSPYAIIDSSCGKTSVYMHECRVDGDINCTNPPPSIEKMNKAVPACITKSFGKGAVTVIPVTLGKPYYEENTFELKKFFAKALADVATKIGLEKGGDADVQLMQKDGRTYVHIVNLLGEHRSERVKTFDLIPPVKDVTIRLRADKKPKSVKIQPQNEPAAFTFDNGVVTIKVDEVKIYDILEIE